MTTQIHAPRFIPREYDVFGGLDVDKKSMSVSFTDHEGGQRSMRMAHSATPLLNYVRKHFGDQRVAFAYEAGPTGFGLHDELVRRAYTCVVVAPSKVPRAPGERVKTNRLDSRKLAESLRGGQLQGIHVPSAVYRDLRHLVQMRDTHVRQLTSSKLRIKSLLLYEGIAFPDPHEKWTARAMRELQTLPCSETVRFKLDDLLDTLHFHFQAAARTTKQIRQHCSAGSGTAAVDRGVAEFAGHRLDRGFASGGPLGQSSRDKECAPDSRLSGLGLQRALHRR